MGGGWSFLSRSYGLAADSVIEATFVLGNGSVVTASSEVFFLFFLISGRKSEKYGEIWRNMNKT